MQRQDYRDLTGTDILPNYDDKTWLIENFKAMIQAVSQISRGNNIELRKRTIKEAATEIRIYTYGMIEKDVSLEKEKAIQAKEALEELQKENLQNPEEEILKLSSYLYEKGLTAWDARKQEDPGRAVLE